MKTIKKILIVGDGPAAWMSAAFLSKTLNNEGPKLQIAIAPSAEPAVYEPEMGASPMLNGFFAFLGFPEDTWMERCAATFKMASRFDKWYDGSGSKEDSFWHSYGQFRGNVGPSLSIMHYWLDRYYQGNHTPFAKSIHDAIYACEAMAAPKPALSQARKGMPPIPYGFHLQTDLMKDLLREVAVNSGVSTIAEQITDANLDNKGYIQSVNTLQGNRLEADLFLDCTGTNATLIDKALQSAYISSANSLFCDQLISARIAYEEGDPFNEKKGGLPPFTTATAASSGWIRHLPLVGKESYTYIFSSRFISESEAINELENQIGQKAEKAEMNKFSFRQGRMETLWNNNCVAIGDSGGYLEPLEATNLSLIQISIQNLIQLFPDSDFDPWLRDTFNKKMSEAYENVQDQITLHYILTKREDTAFWQMVKNETQISDNLQSRLKAWKNQWLTEQDSIALFGPFNHISVLAGMHYLPEKPLPAAGFYRAEANKMLFDAIQKSGEQLAKTLPSQAEYFKKINRIKEFKANAAW